ncbi:MAG: DUF2793 domain-containing protein [Amaricoccus sp.]|uniref:DUF2793 domain-containing protein n=1 Tax=Amaricoccus sp. TaxID=1872485 RepID=UPI0039E4741D
MLDRNLTAPPGSPADGARYIVASGGSGAWDGWDLNIAYRIDGAWMKLAPQEGWVAWVADEDKLLVWSGSAWAEVSGGGGGDAAFDTVSIGGATADAVSRLAVAADETLLTHAGDGHQVKVNKQAAPDTASLLFQDNWSGRAEMGLAGDDDFVVKVSANGSTWREALKVDGATGKVAMLPGGLLGGGRLKSVQKFTASGTWTRPSGIRLIVVEVIGGGGGGGGVSGAASSIGAAGGGGGGAYNSLLIEDPAASYVVVVGSGGSSGANTGGTGGTGGSSSFGGSICAADGGDGGVGQTAGTAAGFSAGGAGGAASPTTTPKWGHGAVGQVGQRISGAVGASGAGAAGPMGGGGVARIASSGGAGGIAPGAGGSGGLSTSATARAGGGGGAGLVVVWEYE